MRFSVHADIQAHGQDGTHHCVGWLNQLLCQVVEGELGVLMGGAQQEVDIGLHCNLCKPHVLLVKTLEQSPHQTS